MQSFSRGFKRSATAPNDFKGTILFNIYKQFFVSTQYK